jgi:hypothetical protein
MMTVGTSIAVSQSAKLQAVAIAIRFMSSAK